MRSVAPRASGHKLGFQVDVVADARRLGQERMAHLLTLEARAVFCQARPGVVRVFERVAGQGGEGFKVSDDRNPVGQTRAGLEAPALHLQADARRPQEKRGDQCEEGVLPGVEPFDVAGELL
jgi:hypothetical protein